MNLFESVWNDNNLNQKQFRKLNNFFWIFSLDLKSSSSSVQNNRELDRS